MNHNKISKSHNNRTNILYHNTTKNLIHFNNKLNSRQFSSSSASNVIDFNLADIGEGIAEVEIMEWYVIF